jgi:hypothetical protein
MATQIVTKCKKCGEDLTLTENGLCDNCESEFQESVQDTWDNFSRQEKDGFIEDWLGEPPVMKYYEANREDLLKAFLDDDNRKED